MIAAQPSGKPDEGLSVVILCREKGVSAPDCGRWTAPFAFVVRPGGTIVRSGRFQKAAIRRPFVAAAMAVET